MLVKIEDIFKICDILGKVQRCGSRRFISDPDLNKFSVNILAGNLLIKNSLKSIFMNQKVKQPRLLKYLGFFHTHTKKVEIGSFIKARIRIWNRPKSTRSDRIRICKTGKMNKCKDTVLAWCTVFSCWSYQDIPLSFITIYSICTDTM
jgi:hypothetical protein